MKIFVLRRGDTQPLGPLTAAEVAEMRIRWQLSDADYYRADGARRWKLVGDLVPGTPHARKHSKLRSTAGIATAALLVLLALALAGGSRSSDQPDAAGPVATALPGDAEQVLSDIAPPESPAPARDSVSTTHPAQNNHANI